jgi:hypothetical protein
MMHQRYLNVSIWLLPKLVAVGNSIHSRDVGQCRGGRAPRWRCPCLTGTNSISQIKERGCWQLDDGFGSSTTL